MERVKLARVSFGRLALRMGIVNQRDLQRACAMTATSGASLESSLLESGALTSELAEYVRAAVRVLGGAHREASSR